VGGGGIFLIDEKTKLNGREKILIKKISEWGDSI